MAEHPLEKIVGSQVWLIDHSINRNKPDVPRVAFVTGTCGALDQVSLFVMNRHQQDCIDSLRPASEVARNVTFTTDKTQRPKGAVQWCYPYEPTVQTPADTDEQDTKPKATKKRAEQPAAA